MTDRFTHVQVVERPISPDDAIKAVSTVIAGAVNLFLGVVRNHHDGKAVLFLEYEAFRAMAEKQLQRIAAEIHERWPVERVWMEHRVGRLEIGEISVIVCVSAAHRAESLAACRYGIERIKQDLPVWKKEHYADGAVWIGEAGSPSDVAPQEHGYWTDHPS